MAAPDGAFNQAYDFFKDALPDAVIIEPHAFGDVRDDRLQAAGLALAEVICNDGMACYASYIVAPTPYTAALESIFVEEEIGAQPPGTHDRAIDTIISGEFDLEFGSYLP